MRYLAVVIMLLICVPAHAIKWWPWANDIVAPASTTAPRPISPRPEMAPKRDAQTQYALIETQRGNVAIQLFGKEAPKTVANFVSLVNQGFYNQNGMRFHRVVPGFVIQTGDPTGTGEGGSPDTIPLEVNNKLSHDSKGMVAMARTYAPDSATSQFYITLTSQRQLDGKYAVFGKVVRGLSVLDKITQGDKLYGVRLITENDLPPAEPKSILGVKFPY